MVDDDAGGAGGAGSPADRVTATLPGGGFVVLATAVTPELEARGWANDVVRQVQAAGGRVVRREEGLGLARFDTEDPHVCRLVVTWSDTDPDTAEPSS